LASRLESLSHSPGRRATLVKAVLFSIPIYHQIALQCPKWVVKAIQKLMRGFLWKGRKDIKGGHCLIGWQRVCRPRKLGGLGIHDMEVMGWALSMRWLWLKKTQPTRPWAALEVQVHPKAVAMFDISVQAVVGDGATILFWTDKWIQGKSIADLVPELVAEVPRRFLKQHTVQEALSSGVWVNDIKRDLSDHAVFLCLCIWVLVQQVQLAPGVPDQHIWTPSLSGKYSTKSEYDRFFTGDVGFEPVGRIWNTWALPKCKFFLWLAAINRCWTADRLARHCLDHPDKCPLCDQEDETVRHILVSCVFAREVWVQILSLVGLQHLSPSLGEGIFQEWWRLAERRVSAVMKKGFNTLVVLVAWWIWKHRNSCVFNGASPNVARIVQDIRDEAEQWCLAGASGLRAFWPYA
jgi:hypothetical protein